MHKSAEKTIMQCDRPQDAFQPDTEALQPYETGPQSPLWRAGEPASIDTQHGNLVEGLIQTATAFPERPAIHYYGQTMTYRELLDAVEGLAGWLAHAGLRKGGRVMIDMQNAPQFVIAFYAVLRANGVVVPLNPMSTTTDIAYYAQDSGARFAIVGEELLHGFLPHIGDSFDHLVRVRYADLVEDPKFRLPAVMKEQVPASAHAIDLRDVLAAGYPPPSLDLAADDLAILPYSSGTTGRPKACMHTHRNAQFVARAQARWYQLDRESAMTSFMPLFHVAGMMASMAAGLHAGASLIIMTRWDAEVIPELFRFYQPTWWSAAPTMVVDVLAAKGFDTDVFASLKTMTGGGASMPAALVERLKTQWGLQFCEGYGLTETISATHLNAVTDTRPQCLGIPIYNTHSRIVDPESLVPLPTGQQGEILISGPQVMKGYWQRPTETAEVLIRQDGRVWLRTGDLGYVDDEGCYYILDRLKRMVSVGGYKVWPAEVEMELYRHPAVEECAVIAVPDARRGEVVHAIVVLKSDSRDHVTEAGIRDFAAGRLARYKVPASVEFRESLPRSGARKIDWRSLQDAAWGRETA